MAPYGRLIPPTASRTEVRELAVDLSTPANLEEITKVEAPAADCARSDKAQNRLAEARQL